MSQKCVEKLEEKTQELIDKHGFVLVHISEYYMDGVGQDITFLYPSELEGLVEDSMDTFTVLDAIRENAKLLLTLNISESECIEVYQKLN